MFQDDNFVYLQNEQDPFTVNEEYCLFLQTIAEKIGVMEETDIDDNVVDFQLNDADENIATPENTNQNFEESLDDVSSKREDEENATDSGENPDDENRFHLLGLPWKRSRKQCTVPKKRRALGKRYNKENIKNYKYYIMSNDNHFSFAKNIKTYILKTLFLKIAFFKEKAYSNK